MPTNAPKKLKADDYLQEMMEQSSEVWLKPLIERVLLTRETPEDSFLGGIYDDFLVEHKLKEKKENNSTAVAPKKAAAKTSGVANHFELKSLEHESGVNALENGATVPFHQKLTVIYGKNGSGKSGFVRILKRVAGSRTQEDIWQNVHNGKTQNRCKAKITYTNGSIDTPYQWNGEGRVPPFDQMAIFDGKCIPIYLNKSLGFSYQPYGFELFQALSTSIQDLHGRLASDIQDAENNKPSLEDIFNSETKVGKFVDGIDSTTKPEDLNKFPAWDAKTQKELAKKIKEKKELQNLDQQAEILQNRHQKLKALEELLLQVQSRVSQPATKIAKGKHVPPNFKKLEVSYLYAPK